MTHPAARFNAKRRSSSFMPEASSRTMRTGSSIELSASTRLQRASSRSGPPANHFRRT